MNSPELLSPAGTLKSMQYAFAYGADAVYAGQPRYSLRVRENEFNKLEVLADAIQEAHRLEKKFYVASNLSPHNSKVRSYLKNMEPVIAMQPDALIMSDPGLIMMVRNHFPEVDIHLSVQANAVNYATVKFWQDYGLTRVILSRELSLKEIEEIRDECPDMELEVFVHGALCIAYSGRCLLSGYINHRDSNQGACTNSCRWEYDVHQAKANDEGDYEFVNAQVKQARIDDEPKVDKNEIYMLEDPSRPGEYMPAFEDEHGTYIMNSKDLRAVQHVKTLVDMGIASLKIEGRTKSSFYVARTAQVYRKAIDDAVAGRDFDQDLMSNLDSLSNRGYTEGFYKRQSASSLQNYDVGTSLSNKQQFVGQVTGIEGGELIVDVRNRFEINDLLELMTPEGNFTFRLEQMLDLSANKVDAAPGSGHVRRIPLSAHGLDAVQNQELREKLLFGLIMKDVERDPRSVLHVIQNA